MFGPACRQLDRRVNWGESFGDSYGLRLTGTLTPAETAQYHFFIRSDDASQFFLNQSGAALPNPRRLQH
jgi:hypothetical protein